MSYMDRQIFAGFETARVSEFFIPAGSKTDSGVADRIMIKLQNHTAPFACPTHVQFVGKLILDRYFAEDIGEINWPAGDDDAAGLEKRKISDQLVPKIEKSRAEIT